MARIRSIKPEAFTSETLAACSVHARWTFAGLWCYVDDEGRGKANAGLVKATVWPLDDSITPERVGEFLNELEASRVICRYEVDGKGYLHVVNFPEHQHPNRPVASKLPACSRRAHGGLSEVAVSPHNNGSGGAPADVPAGTEVTAGAEPAKTGRTAKKPAGQGALTEDSLSAHGARAAKSPGTPPTPLRNEQGEGDGGEVPPSAAREPDTAQVLVAEWIGHCRKRPPERVVSRIGRELTVMLGQDIDKDDVRRGLAIWHQRGLDPSVLASVVNEVMNASPGGGRSPNGRTPPGQPAVPPSASPRDEHRYRR